MSKFWKTLLPLSAYFISLIYKAYYFFFIRTYINGKGHWKKIRDKGSSVIHAIWHNDELIQPYMNAHSDITIMISLSPDGELLSKALKHLGYKSIRGSSSRRGKEALREMIDTAKNNIDVVFATDGPKGPRHKVKPGVVIAASETGKPIIASVCSASKKFIFKKSWDKGILPLPFSKTLVMYSEPIYIPPNLDELKLKSEIERVEKILIKLTENAANYFNIERVHFSCLHKFFFDFTLLRKILLFPVSIIYSLIINFRNILFNIHFLKQYQSKSNVISIGNITLGGTGKTPLTLYIANNIKNVNPTEKLMLIGRNFSDESKMLKDFGYNVLSHKSKSSAIKITDSKHDIDTIIVDDGFQHRYFKRDHNILAINAAQDLKGNLLFPAGTLREPIRNIKRATLIVITRTDEIEYNKRIMNNKPWGINSLIKHIKKYNSDCPIVESIFEADCTHDLTDKQVLLFTATANPKSFYLQACKLGAIVTKQVLFPDHYQYTRNDVDMLKSEQKKVDLLLTTRKDAAKLKGLNLSFQILDIKFKIIKTHGKTPDFIN